MNEAAIKDVWKSYDQRLDESLVLSRAHTEAITRFKVKSIISSMTPIKLAAVLAGLLWVGFVDTLLINLYDVASPFFLVSAGIQVLLTKLAIGVYGYQLLLIRQVDVSEPILATQHQLARLRSSTLWVTRILFLQLPVWTTFYWSEDLFRNGPAALLALQLGVTVLATGLAVWLFLNIRAGQANSTWFRLVFSGNEWTPVSKAIALLDQIRDYTGEKTPEGGRV